ncbi:MAG: sugar translocase [Dorea sp.]|jgi:O-antigen/teichoic acid export membrane protein|nr:sugar translocase [Dorea sp.]MCI9453957.1 sugar translocase [Dorea sp.]
MKSRTYNSLKNVSISLVEQVIVTLLTFITRTVFIYKLGETYLGINGLFSNILSLLSLSDLGVGTAILFSMYKPRANQDYEKVRALLDLYKKIYCFVGMGMAILGLALVPYLKWFISGISNISLEFLSVIYILYLLNTTISYFYSYKRSILIVEQDNHVISLIQIFTSLMQNLGQIIILILFKNFLMYLLLQILCTLINNIWISKYVNLHYEYMGKKACPLDNKTKKELKQNIFAMFISKISSVTVSSTDNLLISKFVSTVVLGYYSNYLLIINMLRTVLMKIFEALAGSIGNAVAMKSKEESKEVFDRILFANYWLISIVTICLYTLVNCFIEIWIGKEYLLNQSIVLLLCINFYMRFIRNTQLAFIDAFGLYWEVRWKSIAETILNVVASLVFLLYFRLGIQGILFGTFVSNIFTNFWYEPYLLYLHKFNCELQEYFVNFGKHILITFGVGFVINVVSVTTNNFFLKINICLWGSNIIYALIFRNSTIFKQYKYMLFEGLRRGIKYLKKGE